MDKREVQKRVLRNGRPISIDSFEWVEETSTFSSSLNNLVIDFSNINSVTIKAGHGATITAGYGATITAWHGATIKAGDNATITAWDNASITAGANAKIATWDKATITAGDGATITAGHGATITAGYEATITAWNEATITAGDNATIKAWGNATIKAEHNATITAGHDATIKVKYGATIKAGSGSKINAGENCVVVRAGKQFCFFEPKPGVEYQFCPDDISGYLENGMYNGEPHIIADGILSKIISRKGDVYKVINYGESEVSWLIKDGDVSAHGSTLKEARESLVYKRTDKDLSKYESMDIDTELSKNDCITMYRSITGACSYGVRSFVEGLEVVKAKYKISELIELTKNRYGNDKLCEFFKV